MENETVAQQVRRKIKRLFLRERHNPQWEGAVVGYAVNYLGKYAWKVGREMDLDDLLQDAYILFLQLSERYDVETPQHFMVIWKTSLRNWVTNLAKRRTRRREQSLGKLEPVYHERELDRIEWEQHKREAPAEVRRLLVLGDVSRKLPRVRRRNRGGKRETTNQYLCRLAGVHSTVPLRAMFDAWLLSAR